MTKKHDVLVDDPHPQSMAALVLLAERLSKECVAEWLAFRAAYLGKFERLVCSHCGKPDLLFETENLDILATVDHIIPLSKGGAQYDEDNCCVACFPCNNNRKNDDMWEFRMRRRPS